MQYETDRYGDPGRWPAAQTWYEASSQGNSGVVIFFHRAGEGNCDGGHFKSQCFTLPSYGFDTLTFGT